MGVARHDVDELIFSPHQSLLIDAPSIHLAEAELAPLREESQGAVPVFLVKLSLVLQAYRRGGAVDNHRSLPQRFVVLVGRFDAHIPEPFAGRFVNGQVGPSLHQIQDLGSIRHQRGSLMKGHFVDSQRLLHARQESDQWLADSAGPNHVDQLLGSHPCSFATWGRRFAIGCYPTDFQ